MTRPDNMTDRLRALACEVVDAVGPMRAREMVAERMLAVLDRAEARLLDAIERGDRSAADRAADRLERVGHCVDEVMAAVTEHTVH